MTRSTGWISAFAFFLVANLSAQSALADGGFSLSLRGQFGFSLLQLAEKNGIRQGTLDGGNVAMQRTDQALTMVTGSQTETLKVDKQGNNLYYRGWLDNSSDVSDFTYYPDKNGYTIKGTLAKTEFELTVDSKKGDLFLFWTDKSGQQQQDPTQPPQDPSQGVVEYDLTLSKSSSVRGDCQGKLSATSGMQQEEVAKIFCHSSGSMLDAFWTSPDDAIAWLIHTQVFPADDNGNNPQH